MNQSSDKRQIIAGKRQTPAKRVTSLSAYGGLDGEASPSRSDVTRFAGVVNTFMVYGIATNERL